MVGGQVSEVIVLPDRIWVDTQERTYNPDTGRNDRLLKSFCAIYLERTDQSLSIRPGDSLWWQGRSAYWTRAAYCRSEEENKRRGLRGGVDFEVEIPRIGYSGVARPVGEVLVADIFL